MKPSEPLISLVLFLCLVFGAWVFAAQSLQAGPSPPTWEIHDLCTMADNDECLRIENAARLSVLARWATVPVVDKTACMQKIDKNGHRSYRALDDCFDDRAMKALESGPAPNK